MAQPLLSVSLVMTNELNLEANNSPFVKLLSDAESIQVREIAPSTQPTILATVDEAVKIFDHSDSNSETRSFLVTVKKKNLVSINTENDSPNSEKSQSEGESEFQSLLSKADILLRNGDYLLARNLYSYVLKKQIKNCPALKGLGICLLHLGDPPAAKKCFNALIEVHSNREGYALLGICLVKEGNDLAAYDSFTKVKEPSCLSEDLKFNFYKEFGNCLTRLERFNEASEAYQQALSINPRSHIILINLGTMEIQRKRFEKATQYFQLAIDFYPSASKAFCGIGIVAQINGEKDIAQLYFLKTLDVDCQNSVALHQLYALADCDTDWKSLKVRLVKALIKDSANLDNRFLLAATLLKQNDWTGCDSELNLILMKSPDHPKARQLREELSLHRHRQGGKI